MTDQTCRETLHRLALQWLASEGHSLLGKSCVPWLAASCPLATSSKIQSPPAPLFHPPLLIHPWRPSNPRPGFPCPSLHAWAIFFISLLGIHHAWPFWATRERRFVEPTTKKRLPCPPGCVYQTRPARHYRFALPLPASASIRQSHTFISFFLRTPSRATPISPRSPQSPFLDFQPHSVRIDPVTPASSATGLHTRLVALLSTFLAPHPGGKSRCRQEMRLPPSREAQVGISKPRVRIPSHSLLHWGG
jgi:hypothetical protein